jgi:hypothetical protein
MILDIWGSLVPHPAFDYAYSWGEGSYKGMVDFPDLQAVFMAHNNNQPPPSPVTLNSNQPPPSPLTLLGYGLERLGVDASTSSSLYSGVASLLMYGLERLEVDLFTRLATVQRSFALEAQQAHAALQANPWNGTALGSMIAASLDQQFASWEVSL